MTDKQEKIDGKECRYWFRPNPGDYRRCALRGKDDNCDEIEDCFIKELLGKLAQKEQECERLKHDNDYEVGALEKTIDNLTAEKDELEKELRQKKIMILMNNDHYFEVDQTNKKLKKTLQEIKEICHDNDELSADFNVVDCDKYKLGKYNLANKIFKKISECEI